MNHIDEVIRQLTANAQSMRALLETIPADQGQWKPGPDTWSLKETMEHVYNEERVDFRKHLREMLNDPPLPWQTVKSEELIIVTDLRQALEGFLAEREESIAWLKALQNPDWDTQTEAPWGTISAGDVLVSWVEHDFLHLRQLIEVLYALSAIQAAPYSVRYAGDW